MNGNSHIILFNTILYILYLLHYRNYTLYFITYYMYQFFSKTKQMQCVSSYVSLFLTSKSISN